MKKEIVLLIPTYKREVFLNILVFFDFCYGVLRVCVCVCMRVHMQVRSIFLYSL